jgi:hypothetical protein
MTSLRVETDNILTNPVDLVEQVLIDRDWAYDRPTDEEIVADAPGEWGDYRIGFAWHSDQGALLFSCGLEAKLPKALSARVYPLLAMVNEKLWVGHFDLVSEDQTIALRHSILLGGGCVLASEQVETLLDIALQECGRFLPAYQALVWGGKTAEEALQFAIFETIGEA